MSFHQLDQDTDAGYQRDLALLENLKETIRNGQHPYYRPIPRPDKLAGLYLGPHRSYVHPHPEQIPDDYRHHTSYNQPLGSSSHPVVIDSDSSRQSSVERKEQPSRPQQDTSVAEVEIIATPPKPVPRPSGLPTSAQQFALPPVSSSHSDLSASTSQTTTVFSQKDTLSVSTQRPTILVPKQTHPEPSGTSAATAVSGPVDGNQSATVSTSPSSTTEQSRSRDTIAAPATRPSPTKSDVKTASSDDKSPGRNPLESREGVWEHRVIYERDSSASDDRHYRPADDRHYRPAADDRHYRPDDRHYRPRDDRVDVDHHDRQRRPSAFLRPDDRHYEPRYSQPPIVAQRASSVASSESRSGDRREVRKAPILIADERKLPQDRLFPPDDPRAPIDNTQKSTSVEKPAVQESREPPETATTPARETQASITSPTAQATPLLPSQPSTSESWQSTLAGKSEPSVPSASAGYQATPVVPTSSTSPEKPAFASEEVTLTMASTPVASPAAAPTTSTSVQSSSNSHSGPSNASGSGANSEARPRLLSEAPPLSDRPPRHPSGPSSASHSRTPSDAARPPPPMERTVSKELKDRIDMGPPVLTPTKSVSLLERMSDAPGRTTRTPTPAAPASAPINGTPLSTSQAPFIKPKAEPIDDHRRLLGDGVKPPPVRAASSMMEMRPPPNSTVASRGRVVSDVSRRTQSPARPASYSRPPPPPHPHDAARPRRDDRLPPASYDRRDDRGPDYRGAPAYRDGFDRPPYREDGRIDYDRQPLYDDRGRQPGRPHWDQGLPPASAPAPAYRDYPADIESRVRRRSPSPGGWGAPPPHKRARDDAYPDYYGRDDEIQRLHYENERLRQAAFSSSMPYEYDRGRDAHGYYDDGRRW